MHCPTRLIRGIRRVALGAVGTAAASLALVACGSGSSPNATAPTAPSAMASMSSMPSSAGSSSMSGGGGMSARATITIKNYAYMGMTTVAPGTSVMVMNDDSVAHTVTSDQGSAFNVTVPAGGTATFNAPAQAGTYAYHCDYHAEMHGTLRVS